MRKRTIKCLFDNILWYVVYMLPLIFAIIHWFKMGIVDLSSVFALGGFELFADNIVFTSLNSIFGASGIVPLFTGSGLLMYLSYFIICMVVHLAVDCLLFIVRLAHNWMDGIVGGKND